MTDDGQCADVIDQCRDQVEDILSRLDFVQWDRFVVGDDAGGHGAYIKVYGWIARDTDQYKDFVLVTFFPETEESLMGFTTSSDEWTQEIHRLMFDVEPDDHNDCQRVENTYEVPNAVELDGQKTLTDGGRTMVEIPEHELQGLYSVLADATEAAATGDPNGCAKLAAEAKEQVIELHKEYGGESA